MSVKFQKTPQGEIAILPRQDYEALVAKAAEADEDSGTSRLVARAKEEVAAGALLLPKNVVDRLADGENPVRVLREWRDITQLYLSLKTDISEEHIADIESGRLVGTTARLLAIAKVLQVPTDLLAPIE